MCSLQLIALLLPFFTVDVPDFLREPEYAVVKDGDSWVVQKPRSRTYPPLVISRHRDRSSAEFRKRSLPRLRLNGLFVRFDPATFERTVIADWTGRDDARQIESDVRSLVKQFASTESRALIDSTPVFMARLFGVTGHTAEEGTDHTKFAIYLDPFQATGRLHAAATLVHELTHVEHYRARGFHANRAAAVLPKQDFILLGLADELCAYEAEARLVNSFLATQSDEMRRVARDAMRMPELNWPVAITVMLGFEGPAQEPRRTLEGRRQVQLDVENTASAYWELHRTDALDPERRRIIRDWHKQSREWRRISATRSAWKKAAP